MSYSGLLRRRMDLLFAIADRAELLLLLDFLGNLLVLKISFGFSFFVDLVQFFDVAAFILLRAVFIGFRSGLGRFLFL